MDDAVVRERVGRVEALLDEVEALTEPAARDTATAVAEALLDLYGEGLARMVDIVAAADDGRLAEAVAADELVSHLLILHGLHPVPVEARVRGALEEVRPYLESHGGDVELLGLDDGVVRLRMEGSCSGCPSSAATLKLAIEEAIHKSAPEVARVEADGAVAPGAAPAPGLLQIEPIAPRPQREAWAEAGDLAGVGPDRAVLREVDGEAILFLRLGRSGLYAYRPACPACGTSLADAAVTEGALACPACGGRYDVRHAGRGIDDTELHLDPVPLLAGGPGEPVQVAVGAVA